MLLRIFTPTFTRSPWSDVTLQYLWALKDSSVLRILVISSTGGHIDEETPWSPFHPLFSTPRSDTRFVNLVVGSGFEQFHTAHVPNLAVVGTVPNLPRPSEVSSLKKYDVTACYRMGDLAPVSELGLALSYLPPERDFLESFFTRAFEDFYAGRRVS